MSREPSASQSASDAEFRAMFSLLPHVNNMVRILAGGQTDPKAVQKPVSLLIGVIIWYMLFTACSL